MLFLLQRRLLRVRTQLPPRSVSALSGEYAMMGGRAWLVVFSKNSTVGFTIHFKRTSSLSVVGHRRSGSGTLNSTQSYGGRSVIFLAGRTLVCLASGTLTPSNSCWRSGVEFKLIIPFPSVMLH